MPTIKTVLIVEDDPGVRNLETQCLELAGHSALAADSAEQALRQIWAVPVDLLVLDYRLPGGTDGLGLYEQARAAGFEIPAILVTGYLEEAMVARALRAGVCDLVTKSPDYLGRLAVAVNRTLAQAGRTAPSPPDHAGLHLAHLWESSLDPMRMTDAAGTLLRVNAAYCRLVGKPREELEGRPFSLGYAPDGRFDAAARHGAQFASGRSESMAVRKIKLWDGREVHLEFSSSFVETPGQPQALLSIIRDISSRVTLEERLRQSQKMDAIGRLAGGVAHDFNNLLTVIGGYSQLLLTSLTEQRQQSLAVEVIKAADRAANLTRQLLAFSRKQILAPTVLDLNLVVQDMAALLRRLIGEDILLDAAPQSGLWLVEADPGCMEQVIVNLAVNARDAMPTGGRLTIETKNVVLDEEYTRTRPDTRPGPHVLLAVSDTGCGMDAATQSRLFEPFFTTKGDRGTGLGLATVYGAVRQSGGHIGVYSEVGRGTTFKVYLPRGKSQPSSGHSSLNVPLPCGKETVLLVEDEPHIRSLAERALRGCGYTVLSAGDGAEGLAVAGLRTGPIDLLVTDVVMPIMGGGQLAEQLQARYSGLKVLCLSGYTDDAVVRHGVLKPGVAFLQKPFTMLALARKVRETLDSGAVPAT